jgi:putative membrane protein insertion efficiency factor
MTAGVRVAIGMITVYQGLLSPWLGPTCRFAPTCSEYAKTALSIHGLAQGLWLAGRRLLRCHPLHPGGYDPPPAGRR